MPRGAAPEGTAGELYTPGGFENTEKKNQFSNGRFPAAWPLGQQREKQGDLFHFFARSARHILVEEGTRSSFTLPSTSLFSSTYDINSNGTQRQQLSRHRNNVSSLHSAFDISSRRQQQNIYVDERERRPLHPRRACCSAARPHRFAGATLLNLRCVEHIALQHALITFVMVVPARVIGFRRHEPACQYNRRDSNPCSKSCQ